MSVRRGRPRNDEIMVTEDQIEKLEIASKQMDEAFPSLFMVPNVCQYRALEAMYTPINESGKIPDMVSVEFANGDGKTHLSILDIIGWNMGPDFLCAEAYPPAAIEVYKRAGEKRDKGLLSMRLVCVADDMKAGGSFHELLKQIFPWAKISAQDNGKCFRQIDVPHPYRKGIKNSITVKTFEQDSASHTGSTCDRVVINEILPDDLWGETSARIRSKKGEIQGSIGMYATILDKATYLNELEDSEKFVLKRVAGHLYENCVGEEVSEEMADEVFQELGIRMEKNPDGPGYITNGVLTKETIDAKIEGWAKGCPHELDARKSGKAIGAGGKIHPTFSRDVHVIPDDTYEKSMKNCPMGQVVDPHSAKPDAVIYFQLLPSDRIAIVDEWPTVNEFGYFERIKEKRFTVPEKCEIWQLFESTRGYHPDENRVGDPNRFREPNSHNTGMLWDLYDNLGFTFNIDVNDELEYGHELVNQYLWCNSEIRRMAPNDPAAQSSLVIYDRCANTIRALSNYSRKAQRDKSQSISDSVDKKFACFAALVRYLVVWHQDHRFDELKPSSDGRSEYDLIKYGRIPKSMRGEFGRGMINTHGRQILTSVLD